MNTHDIELPPLPGGIELQKVSMRGPVGVGEAMQQYARAAIEADRRKQGDAAKVLAELVALIPLADTLNASASCQDLIDYFKGVIADRKRRGEPVQALLQQARRVRNYSDPDQVFEAVPVSAFDVETAPQPDEPVKVPGDAPAALRFAAQLVELYDDATMVNDYMIDSSDCAGILNALADYFARFGQPAQPAANPEHQQLREFYGVQIDDELIDAQQQHIEKMQAKLAGAPSMALNRVREG